LGCRCPAGPTSLRPAALTGITREPALRARNELVTASVFRLSFLGNRQRGPRGGRDQRSVRRGASLCRAHVRPRLPRPPCGTGSRVAGPTGRASRRRARSSERAQCPPVGPRGTRHGRSPGGERERRSHTLPREPLDEGSVPRSRRPPVARRVIPASSVAADDDDIAGAGDADAFRAVSLAFRRQARCVPRHQDLVIADTDGDLASVEIGRPALVLLHDPILPPASKTYESERTNWA
jgi:hypothetical protein